MDNLTHSLTGLMIARCGFGRRTSASALIGVLAANAPDIDVIAGLWGAISYLDHHRGITHSLILLPLIAIFPPLVARYLFRRSIRWLPAYVLSLAAVVSHPLLDWTNIYGTRWFMPFSGQWSRLDITSVIDLWIWAALILGVAAPALAGLVSSEIGARSNAGRGWAIFALSFLVLYNYGRFLTHQRAVTVMEGRMYNGSSPKRVSALPHPANPFVWYGVVEGTDFVSVHSVRLLSEFDPTEGRQYWTAQPSPAIEAARRDPTFQGLLRFSQLPFWRVTPSPEGWQVELMDLRFSTPAEPRFTASAIVDTSFRVDKTSFHF